MKYLPIDPTKRAKPYPKGKGEYYVLMQWPARLVILDEDFRFCDPGLQTIPEIEMKDATNGAVPMHVDVEEEQEGYGAVPMHADVEEEQEGDASVPMHVDMVDVADTVDAEEDLGDGSGPSIEESAPGPVESMRPASTCPRSGGLRRSARLAHSGVGSNFTPSGRRFSMRLRSLQKET